MYLLRVMAGPAQPVSGLPAVGLPLLDAMRIYFMSSKYNYLLFLTSLICHFAS